ncbi:hypothetical protein N7517_001189 [Penicillium concentricum]|uniref:Uncharacterized protein n=1 Tax=Penicillium concentricum TaxID=293559 RepID=A0A9W9SVI1_9EURO|nr:uncharacterized protein N7517_001189 [Penicillium concentricum]KAJ5383278.1 hypothetical protein N7517_001189 [Penicillium concentricum]
MDTLDLTSWNMEPDIRRMVEVLVIVISSSYGDADIDLWPLQIYDQDEVKIDISGNTSPHAQLPTLSVEEHTLKATADH